ncbi:GroES-like protein [Hypoxylon sp. FL1284]|nr:GroES-like protein [Hypoxylon sp. FL1284]
MAATIPDKMQAVQVTAFNKPYEIRTVPVPAVGPHDLLVKVAVASYCHTDGMVAAGTFGTPLPTTASHEGAGTIAAIGSAVDPDAFLPGDRVMCGLPTAPCGECADCRSSSASDTRQYCAATAGHVGVQLDGCLAQFVRVDARFTTRLPPNISLRAAAPLACAGRTAWAAVSRARDAVARFDPATSPHWLLVVGAGGGLGHLAVQFARARGLRVVAVDARDGALALARSCGADAVVDARRGDRAAVVKEVRLLTGGSGQGQGAHAALVLSDADGATALAAAATRMHGTVVQVAQPPEVKVPFRELVFRDVRLRGSLLCAPEESEEMVGFMAEREREGKGVRVETVAFQGLESIEELLRLVRSGELRGKAVVVVDPGQLEGEGRLGRE